MTITAVVLNDLEGHSQVAVFFQMQSVEYLCSILYHFHWQCAVGPSALAEHLVFIGRLQTREQFMVETRKVDNNKIEIYLQWKTNRKSYMAYQMAATALTLNDLEGHSLVAGLFKCNPSNIFAAFQTISTDSVLARFLCSSRASCIYAHLLFVN